MRLRTARKIMKHCRKWPPVFWSIMPPFYNPEQRVLAYNRVKHTREAKADMQTTLDRILVRVQKSIRESLR